MTCFYLPTKELRFGFVVSKKVGNAVTRNRIKRKFRVIARELSFETGSFIFLAKPEIVSLDYSEIKDDIIKLLKKIDENLIISN